MGESLGFCQLLTGNRRGRKVGCLWSTTTMGPDFNGHRSPWVWGTGPRPTRAQIKRALWV